MFIMFVKSPEYIGKLVTGLLGDMEVEILVQPNYYNWQSNVFMALLYFHRNTVNTKSNQYN